MKQNNSLVKINFEYQEVVYKARVYKNLTTVILLPDGTMLQTNRATHAKGPRRNRGVTSYTKNIFDGDGDLVPFDVIRTPNEQCTPLDVKFPIVFAEETN